MDENDLPIIGMGPKPRVVLWYPTAIINCACQPDRVTLIVVTGTSNSVICGSCHRLHRIAGFGPQDAEGIPTIIADVIVPTPSGSVM